MVSGSLDMTVRVWDLANGTQVLYNVDQLEFSKSSPPSPSLLSPSVANIVLTPPLEENTIMYKIYIFFKIRFAAFVLTPHRCL